MVVCTHMISYELARQLKNAGFPQTTEFFFIDTNKTEPERPLTWETIEHEWGHCRRFHEVLTFAAPTLSELISACGACGFALLQFYKGDWCAYSGYADDDYTYRFFGDTPEEAVAQLWLRLHRPA